jgi:hypothetical protein
MLNVITICWAAPPQCPLALCSARAVDSSNRDVTPHARASCPLGVWACPRYLTASRCMPPTFRCFLRRRATSSWLALQPLSSSLHLVLCGTNWSLLCAKARSDMLSMRCHFLMLRPLLAQRARQHMLAQRPRTPSTGFLRNVLGCHHVLAQTQRARTRPRLLSAQGVGPPTRFCAPRTSALAALAGAGAGKLASATTHHLHQAECLPH